MRGSQSRAQTIIATLVSEGAETETGCVDDLGCVACDGDCNRRRDQRQLAPNTSNRPAKQPPSSPPPPFREQPPKDWRAIGSKKVVAAVNDGNLWRTSTDTIHTTIGLAALPSVRPTSSPTIAPTGGGSASTNAESTRSSSQHRGQLSRQRRVAVVSITLPTIGADALKSDYDDVTHVSTSIVIVNTDLTSLSGWFPNLVSVSLNVQISGNGALTTMDGSFQKLKLVSGFLVITGNGALGELGSAFPFPPPASLVSGYLDVNNNPVLTSLGSAFLGLITISGYNSVYANAELSDLGTAFSGLVTISGYRSIYDNFLLSTLGDAYSSLVTVSGYDNVVLYSLSPTISPTTSDPTTSPTTSDPTTSPSVSPTI